MDYLTSQVYHQHGVGSLWLCTLQKGCTRLAAASDKGYQLLAHGRRLSPGTLAFSTIKTGRHDIAEILLKVALNTKNQNKKICTLEVLDFHHEFVERYTVYLHLRNRLLNQGYKKIRLIRSLKKFIFRYQYLVEIYSVSAETIISDALSYSENV